MTDTPIHMQQVRSDLRSEIKDLRDELGDDRQNLERFYTRNEDDHKVIMSAVSELISDKKALRMVGILVGIALGSIVGIAIWFSDRISINAERINEVRAEERGNARQGFQLAEDLRRDIDRNELEIDRLRAKHGLKPGKKE
jgi:hypothetical protein